MEEYDSDPPQFVSPRVPGHNLRSIRTAPSFFVPSEHALSEVVASRMREISPACFSCVTPEQHADPEAAEPKRRSPSQMAANNSKTQLGRKLGKEAQAELAMLKLEEPRVGHGPFDAA